jgi:hypothetical protein
MAKEVFEVLSFATGEGRVHCKVELDREWFCEGKLPTIIVLPDGLTAYKYLNHYNIEDGYFVSTTDVVKEDK